MRKGSIVLVPFPFTDLSGKKVRPALVLHASTKGEDFIAVFISSVAPKGPESFTIRVAPTLVNGLKAMSHVRVEKLATLQKKIVIGVLGTLEPKSQKAVDGMLKKLFAT